jgi:6-pyruvoyltetrahydropterin/6-carboxytetrahydropterin synthase
MFEMVFTRKWESAHRFIAGENASTLCSQPHGHTWQVEARLVTKSPVVLDANTNTVVLFQKAKQRWHQFIDNSVDHSFMFNHQDPLLSFMLKENPQGRHMVFPGDPTTEMIAVAFKAKLESTLKDENLPLTCSSLRIQETQTNAIVFSGLSEEVLKLPGDPLHFWWNRADMTFNDLGRFQNGYPTA